MTLKREESNNDNGAHPFYDSIGVVPGPTLGWLAETIINAIPSNQTPELRQMRLIDHQIGLAVGPTKTAGPLQ